MSQLWIKICGITQNSDARAAVDSGADAIGLVFYDKSTRAISADQVEGITEGIKGKSKVVALFVDPDVAQVEATLESGRVDILQFHGSETVEFCSSFGLPYMKVFAVRDADEVCRSMENYDSAELILLDSYSNKAPGGTGKVFDWDIAKTIVETTDSRIVVAGGLNPENVQTAVSKIKPFGIDVSSGVESSFGIKDSEKVKAFITGARSV